MLCRVCISYHKFSPCIDADYWDSDYLTPLCVKIDYTKIVFSREDLHDIFAGRYFLTFCVSFLDSKEMKEGDIWTTHYRNNYVELFNKLIESPHVDCLKKTRQLYELLDQYSKDVRGENFFRFDMKYSFPDNDRPFKRLYGRAIRNLWNKYGAKVWAELEKAQNENVQNANELITD
jgi:hypothetical protein